MAFQVFLKIESAVPNQFQGESQDPDHRNWIEIENFSMGVTSPKSTIHQITFIKAVDRSSRALYPAMKKHAHFKRIVLHVVNRDSHQRVINSSWWEFHDAQAIGSTVGGSKHSDNVGPVETLSFVFKSVTHGFRSPGKDVSNSADDRPVRRDEQADATPARRVSAGAVALATHMLRQHASG